MIYYKDKSGEYVLTATEFTVNWRVYKIVGNEKTTEIVNGKRISHHKDVIKNDKGEYKHMTREQLIEFINKDIANQQ